MLDRRQSQKSLLKEDINILTEKIILFQNNNYIDRQQMPEARRFSRLNPKQQTLTAENFPVDIDIADKEIIEDIREELEKIDVPEYIKIEEQEKAI